MSILENNIGQSITIVFGESNNMSTYPTFLGIGLENEEKATLFLRNSYFLHICGEINDGFMGNIIGRCLVLGYIQSI